MDEDGTLELPSLNMALLDVAQSPMLTEYILWILSVAAT